MEIKKVRREKVWERGGRYGQRERELVMERGRERGEKDGEKMERAR